MDEDNKNQGDDQLTPEQELEQLRAKVAQLEPLSTEIETLRESNRKLEEVSRSKDINFKRLRDLTKEETDKLTAQERLVLQNQEIVQQELDTLRKSQEEFTSTQFNTTKKNLISKYAGNDTEVYKLISDHYELLNIDDSTEDGMKDRVNKAVLLIKASQPDALRVGINARGGTGGSPSTGGGFADTPEGKQLAQSMGILPTK